MAHILILYAVKVSVALALFYGLYLLCMRNDTFLKLRRFYFLFVIVFSLAYPLFNIELPAREKAVVELPAYWISDLDMLYTVQPVAQENTTDIILSVLPALFLLGSAVMAIKFAIQLGSVVRLIIRNSRKTGASFRIVPVGGKKISPFSFFGYIFIDAAQTDAKELSEILNHEKVHARQLHSFDVLLSHLLCIGFWWNPIVWLMRRDIKANLEYLADQGALEMGVDAKLYQYALLNLSIENTGIPIINNFNVSQLKMRIVMMNKNKTPWLLSAKYLLVVPVGAALMLGNAIQASSNPMELLSEVMSVHSPNTDGVSGATTEPQQPAKTEEMPPAGTVEHKSVSVVTTVIGDEKPFISVEQMPQYPGGNAEMMKYLAKNLKYPEKARNDNVMGRVIVRFVVDKDGTIKDATIQRGLSPEMDAEALRVVNAMPKWTPGKQNGKAVPVYYTLPILFHLQVQGKYVGVSKSESAENEVVVVAYDTPAKTADGDEPYTSVEQMPQFMGGIEGLMNYMKNNLKYPVEAQKNKVEGRVIVRFVVDKDGAVKDVEVMRGLSPETDAEALRVVNAMPKWVPGRQKGEAVAVYFTLPILYKLPDNGKAEPAKE
jgi:TonB family protein